jgi:hypothetical protein
MNKKGQIVMFKSILVIIGLILLITSFTFIEPLKETLDDLRGSSNLNCKGVSDFNQTAYDEQDTLARLTYRPTCAAPGFLLIYLLLSVIVGVFIMIGTNGGQK